jgi:hypothetical protein
MKPTIFNINGSIIAMREGTTEKDILNALMRALTEIDGKAVVSITPVPTRPIPDADENLNTDNQ